MILYKYKGIYYFSFKECVKQVPRVHLFSVKEIPENMAMQMGIAKLNINDSQIQHLINKQKEKATRLRSQYLKETEQYIKPNYQIEQLDLDSVITYREYLTNLINNIDWWKEFPMSLEEWISNDNGFYI